MWSRTREATIPVQQAAKRSSFQEHSRPQSTRCSMRHSPTSAAAIAGASWPIIYCIYIYKDVKTYIYIQYMICIIIKSRSWQSGWWCNCNQPPKQSWGRILIHPNPSYKMENIGKQTKTNNESISPSPSPDVCWSSWDIWVEFFTGCPFASKMPCPQLLPLDPSLDGILTNTDLGRQWGWQKPLP